MSRPRQLYEVIADACHESEKHAKKELRTTLTFRVLIAGRLDQVAAFASYALHGKFMFLLRIQSMQAIRKASSREREGWVEIEEIKRTP
jgi:hypothetical protein